MRSSPGAGARIKAARLKKGWSQTELADKLGVSQPAVAHWESGAHAPRFALLPRIAAMLEIPREDIAPRRKRRAPDLQLNVRTTQMLDYRSAPSLPYEVSRLELSFAEQTERSAPVDETAEPATVSDGVAILPAQQRAPAPR